jgi:hypothetical protein
MINTFYVVKSEFCFILLSKLLIGVSNCSKIVELEEELRVVGNNLKSLEVSEEKVCVWSLRTPPEPSGFYSLFNLHIGHAHYMEFTQNWHTRISPKTPHFLNLKFTRSNIHKISALFNK